MTEIMSRDFKLKFDQLKENNPTGESSEALQNENFDTPGHVRNLCLVWPDGRMKFLNYAYLLSAEYLPDDGNIILVFTSEHVILRGNNLGILFFNLIDHKPRIISITDKRYEQLNGTTKLIITEISIIAV